MTNKEIFALSNQVAKNLKAQGQAKAIPATKQIVYDTISQVLNKHTIQLEKEGEDTTSPELTDAQLRARIKKHLIIRLESGSLQAAEIAQLKDIFGLNAVENDLQIEVTSFKDTVVECPKCGQNVYEPLV